jgi:pilus assembly protein CpaE
MAKPTQPTRLISVSKNPALLQAIETALQKEEDFELLQSPTYAENAIQTIQMLEPDIILLDFQYEGEQIYDTIDDIVLKFPKLSVIVILPEEEIRNSNRVILAGARAFLMFPFSHINLLSALRRVMELQTRTTSTSSQPSLASLFASSQKTFVVFSPKGGVGCTTIATNLAIALHQQTGEEVLLMDGKHLFGDVALMLNLRTPNSVADLISHAGVLDEGLIRQVTTKHASGIYILPSPFSISIAQGIRPDDLYKVILGLQKVFPNIIIDGGSYLNDVAVTYMDAAFRLVLVVNPDLASLRGARQFMDISRTLSYPREKILLLLNKAGRKSNVHLVEIEKVLRTKVFASIPMDEQIAQSSVNDGIPIMIKKSGHEISKAFRLFSKNLLAEITSSRSSLMADTGKATSDDLSKSSRLG